MQCQLAYHNQDQFMVGDIDDVDVIFGENVYDADETIVIRNQLSCSLCDFAALVEGMLR